MSDLDEHKRLLNSIPIERYFYNTFGYLSVPINKINIKSYFEDEITRNLNLKPLKNIEETYSGEDNRYSNIRCANLTNHNIINIFYNPIILDKIRKILGDFIILSELESFYLSNTLAHRDLIAEINQMKLLFYLDDVSSIDKGPLWVLPGSHNIYDKYSSSIGLNINWPPSFLGDSGIIRDPDDYISKNMPKHYLLSDQDKVLLFNHNLIHGSDGNIIQPNRLRRAIGMTVIAVDRNNEMLMDKIFCFYKEFNLSNNNYIYEYCKSNNPEWLHHFYNFRNDKRYNPNYINVFKSSEDGTDRNSIILDTQHNRWQFFIDHIRNVRTELINNNLNTGYVKDMKWSSDNSNSFKGL